MLNREVYEVGINQYVVGWAELCVVLEEHSNFLFLHVSYGNLIQLGRFGLVCVVNILCFLEWIRFLVHLSTPEKSVKFALLLTIYYHLG